MPWSRCAWRCCSCPPTAWRPATRKGDKLYKLGVQAEAHKEYDKALEYFQQAQKEDPKEPTYELATRRARFESGRRRT